MEMESSPLLRVVAVSSSSVSSIIKMNDNDDDDDDIPHNSFLGSPAHSLVGGSEREREPPSVRNGTDRPRRGAERERRKVSISGGRAGKGAARRTQQERERANWGGADNAVLVQRPGAKTERLEF